MPTPWLSWPNRLASTRWSATSLASSAELPSARQIAIVKACNRSGLTRTSPTPLCPMAIRFSPFSRGKVPRRSVSVNLVKAVRSNPTRRMTNPGKECYLSRMRGLFRWACLVRLCAGGLGLDRAAAQTTVPPPQRPFSQLVDLWTRQLDRIAYRADQPDILPAEIDALREQAADVRTAAAAAAALARNDLADTKKLLAPLEVKPGTDQPPETDAVKAERQRLTEQASISESRVKQCEVIIARADQLQERMTKLRSEVVMKTLLHRDVSPLSPSVWRRLGPELGASVQTISQALSIWSRNGLKAL